MSYADTLNQSLTLPCGTALPNRFGKSAMSEALGTIDNHVTPALETLYGRWSDGGTGLLITGNIMIDRNHTGEPNNVVLENENDMPLLQRWAEAGKRQGNHIWVQLNHPGKQIPRMLASGDTLAPSAVPFGKELKSAFKTPRALTEEEIRDIIKRFATSAAIAKKAGFTGVQIHGAHGYLVSQFLSGHHNQRTDQWGGSLENRMRFPLEIYRAIRKAVGDEYPVSIKLNSADFQRGGFTEEESMTVAQTLAEEGLDLLEISGGNYENPAMAGAKGVRESTVAREAYFLGLCPDNPRASIHSADGHRRLPLRQSHGGCRGKWCHRSCRHRPPTGGGAGSSQAHSCRPGSCGQPGHAPQDRHQGHRQNGHDGSFLVLPPVASHGQGTGPETG